MSPKVAAQQYVSQLLAQGVRGLHRGPELESPVSNGKRPLGVLTVTL